MISKILGVWLLLFGLSYGEVTVAVFDTNVTGTVLITDSTVMVDIDLSQLDQSSFPTDCFDNGLKYHIHEKWVFDSNDIKSKIGAVQCGKNTTGGHYDPWAACAPQSGNLYCSPNGGCIDSSAYSCTPEIYRNNPYACEVGDWSGKYGILTIDANGLIKRNDSSFWEIDAREVANKSIVFHCNTVNAERAFCAQFRQVSDNQIDNHLEQNSTVSTVTADFSDALGTTSAITMVEDGTYTVILDITMTNVTCSSLTYQIHNAWTDSSHESLLGSSCNSVVGEFYDPTKTCLPSSDETEYCMENKLCGNESWTYSCNFNIDPYMCSPSDLGSKWGRLNVSQGILQITDKKDDLLPPLNIITGKSIVLLCNTGDVIACAQIKTVTSTTVEPDSARSISILIAFFVATIASLFL